MKLRHMSALNVGGGDGPGDQFSTASLTRAQNADRRPSSTRTATTNQDSNDQQQQQVHLRELRNMTTNEKVAGTGGGGKKCSTGALQLAAIVHYDSLASYCWPDGDESAGNNKSPLTWQAPSPGTRLPPRECCDTTPATTTCDARQASRASDDAHLESGAQEKTEEAEERSRKKSESSNNKTGNKFSRLFFTKNHKSKQQAKLMIDNADGGSPLDGHPGGGGGCHDLQCAHSPSESSTSTEEGTRRATSNKQRRVIEFKFDLIVEGEQVMSAAATDDHDDDELSSSAKLDTASTLKDHDGAPPSPLTSRNILRPIQQRKLLDQVNDLIESFVLDSMDVCLMTSGRARRPALASGAAQRQGGQAGSPFDYLLQSSELSLTYAFQLLKAVGNSPPSAAVNQQLRRTESTSDNNNIRSTCSPLTVDEHSIELEALLFIERQEDQDLEIVDLLPISAGVPTRECASVQEALDLLRQIKVQLNSKTGLHQIHEHKNCHPTQTTLMINLKLKQQVQGGLFTNRMCLMDLGERPKSSCLRPVLESIFSGQALAYLKSQKLRQQTQELSMVADDNIYDPALDTLNPNNKHCHLTASRLSSPPPLTSRHLAKLIQAEWLIYKQLSSALIKSLMIVHCHRLAPETSPSSSSPPDAPKDQVTRNEMIKSIESQLMDYNLNLLEFASAIKRAASLRLKRRRRHLKSHLNANALTSSNLSLASDTNYRSYRSSPGLPEAQDHDDEKLNKCHQDLMISSPFRHAHNHHHHRAHNRHRNRQHSRCADCDSPPPLQLTSQVAAAAHHLPAHLLDRYNLSYNKSNYRKLDKRNHNHRHHHRHNHHREHQYQHHRHDRHRCSCDTPSHAHRSGRSTRAGSLNRHCSLTASSSCRQCGGDELETSSQLSTSSSSGHQTLSSSRLRRLLSGKSGALAGSQQLAFSDDDEIQGQEVEEFEDSLASAATSTLLQSCSLHLQAQTQAQVARPRRISNGLMTPGKPSSTAASSVASWAARARQQLSGVQRQQAALEQTSSPSEQSACTLDDSIELQSFSSSNGLPSGGRHGNVNKFCEDICGDNNHQAVELSSSNRDLNLTGSESRPTCPMVVVAEPPRQLKLEQFLNQLTSYIGPASAIANAERTHTTVEINSLKPSNLNEDEDDDDCRSHSSILEHLSSLTLESKNLKSFVNQQQQQLHKHLSHEEGNEPTSRVSIVTSGDDIKQWPLPPEAMNGHLQQLLKSTLKLQQQQQPGPLTIDCGLGQGQNVASGRLGMSDSGADSQHRRRATHLENFTPPTSMESGCSSSSSSSSRRGETPINPPQLYASVIKQNT